MGIIAKTPWNLCCTLYSSERLTLSKSIIKTTIRSIFEINFVEKSYFALYYQFKNIKDRPYRFYRQVFLV